MATIDYFFSPLSPYAYLAGTELETIAARHGASISYKPIDIQGLFARTGGVPLSERPQSRIDYRAQDLLRVAASTGLPFNLKPAHWPTNAAPAAYAIIAASRTEGGDLGALVQGFMQAVWADQKDIADDDTVRACLTAAGFDASLADSGLLVGAETYGHNLEQAVLRGVFGSPFYIVAEDDARFWGRDRLTFLDAHLAAMG